MAKVEVYILSGFLGSGKTTLLQQLLKQEQENNRKIAVVMNEVGNVSIDSDAVPENTPLKELLNGCVCCTIQDEFESQLYSLLQEFDLDAIYIEATGVAHPIELLDACLSPLYADQIEIRGIVSVVDAKRWRDRRQLGPEVVALLHEQIRHADMILINKIENLTEQELAMITFEIQGYNPYGKTVVTTYSAINLTDVWNLKRNARKEHVPVKLNEQLRIQSYVHTFSRPVNVEKFEKWLSHVPDTIYRMKGYIRFARMDGLYSFQYAYGTPIYMKETMNVATNLVIIGDNLRKEDIQRELELMEE